MTATDLQQLVRLLQGLGLTVVWVDLEKGQLTVQVPPAR